MSICIINHSNVDGKKRVRKKLYLGTHGVAKDGPILRKVEIAFKERVA